MLQGVTRDLRSQAVRTNTQDLLPCCAHHWVGEMTCHGVPRCHVHCPGQYNIVSTPQMWQGRRHNVCVGAQTQRHAHLGKVCSHKGALGAPGIRRGFSVQHQKVHATHLKGIEGPLSAEPLTAAQPQPLRGLTVAWACGSLPGWRVKPAAVRAATKHPAGCCTYALEGWALANRARGP